MNKNLFKKSTENPEMKPRAGEVALKEWCMTEAERCSTPDKHISESTIRNRVSRGLYHGLKLRRVTERTVFVDTTSEVIYKPAFAAPATV